MKKVKISVICPTIRKDGLDIVHKSLQAQTFRDFEFLIGSKFDPGIPDAKWILDDFRGGFWTLGRIYNKLIKNSSGELIVSWQDNIFAESDALEKFWIAYEQTRDAAISGVGDQYESLDKWGKPQIKIWADPRKRTEDGSFYEINFPDVEWNFCAIPKKTLIDIGGFDEELDMLGYGLDGYGVNERLNDVGGRFFIDQTNESFTIRHDRSDFGGEDNWDKNNLIHNGKYDKRKIELVKSGQWPRLDYLK